MMAVLAFVLEEAITGVPIVQLTPALFHPLWDSPQLWSFLDASYSVASEAQRISTDQLPDAAFAVTGSAFDSIPVEEAVKMLPNLAAESTAAVVEEAAKAVPSLAVESAAAVVEEVAKVVPDVPAAVV